MSKLRNLKLKEIEVLNDAELKVMSTSAYSSSGSNTSGSGSGSGSGLTKWQQECVNKSLCARCDFWDEKNKRYIVNGGYCSQNAFSSHRYCSTLNCHY